MGVAARRNRSGRRRGRWWLRGTRVLFRYGRSYLDRTNAISLYPPELPLVAEPIPPLDGLALAGCSERRRPGRLGPAGRPSIVCSASARPRRTPLSSTPSPTSSSREPTGSAVSTSRPALTEYVPRVTTAALEELIDGVKKVEAGVPLPEPIADAFQHGSVIGGARPKVLLQHGDRRLIAKLQSSRDPFAVVKAEGVAMGLAARCGLAVAAVEVTEAMDLDVLLVERFDRPAPGQRRLVVSALTMLQLDEMMARYATYADLADLIRASLRGTGGHASGAVQPDRLQHPGRQHRRPRPQPLRAFWDGSAPVTTPAYDIQPQNRTGWIADQAMAYGRDGAGQPPGAADRRCHEYLLMPAGQGHRPAPADHHRDELPRPPTWRA